MRILYAMRDKDFLGELVETFIKCLGIYPVGSMVHLNTGEVAVVCGSNKLSPLQPIVKIILDRNQIHRVHQLLDLSSPEAKALGEDIIISGPLDPTNLGIAPQSFF